MGARSALYSGQAPPSGPECLAGVVSDNQHDQCNLERIQVYSRRLRFADAGTAPSLVWLTC